MKLGWCGPNENAAIIAKAGLDFIEVPLAPLVLRIRRALQPRKGPLPRASCRHRPSTYFCRAICAWSAPTSIFVA
jgi:hypothetical protein